jgi:hypothetical protein
VKIIEAIDSMPLLKSMEIIDAWIQEARTVPSIYVKIPDYKPVPVEFERCSEESKTWLDFSSRFKEDGVSENITRVVMYKDYLELRLVSCEHSYVSDFRVLMGEDYSTTFLPFIYTQKIKWLRGLLGGESNFADPRSPRVELEFESDIEIWDDSPEYAVHNELHSFEEMFQLRNDFLAVGELQHLIDLLALRKVKGNLYELFGYYDSSDQFVSIKVSADGRMFRILQKLVVVAFAARQRNLVIDRSVDPYFEKLLVLEPEFNEFLDGVQLIHRDL